MNQTRRDLQSAAWRIAHRLDRSGAEPWIPARYPSLLEEVDKVLDDLPERLRPRLRELFGLRGTAHAALQRIWEREDGFIAAGRFAGRESGRATNELLFAGPSLYSRTFGDASVKWHLEADVRHYAEESLEDYEALVDAREGLRIAFWDLYETPPVLDFCLEAVLESADGALLARVPVRDIFASKGEAVGPRLARYLKAFDTDRKARNRLKELQTLLATAGVKAPHQGARPGFDTALELIAVRDVRQLFSACNDEPDPAERNHTARAYAEVLRAGMHEYRYVNSTRYAPQLLHWDRDKLPVLAELLLDDVEASSTRPWTRSEPFEAALEVLRTAPHRGARHELRQWLTVRLITDLAQPAIRALRVLPDAHRTVTLPVAGDIVHLWPLEESDEMTTLCGEKADDDIYNAIQDWARLLRGEGDRSLCPFCRRSRWPHALQQLSPTPGLDLAAHDAVAAIVDEALDQAVRDQYWSEPDRDAVLDALVCPVRNRLQEQLVAQGTSVYDHALQALDALPDSYLNHLRRLGESGQDITPPVRDENDSWTILQMSYDRQREMAFWYQAICRRAGAAPVGVPSRAVPRDRVDDLPHRRRRCESRLSVKAASREGTR